jgi:lactoylglutathione lyase
MKKRAFFLIGIITSLICASQVYSQSHTQKPILNHIAVYVVNLTESNNFYQQIIGLDTIPEPFRDGKHCWFSIGAKAQLHLIKGALAPMPHDKNSHLCFSVTSVKNFISTLKKNKIEFENWQGEKNSITKRIDGVQQIYCKDPDGYWIEINDATE